MGSEEGGRGLAPDCYTSPDVYTLERERIFGREWLLLGRADEVPEPGDYLGVELLGEPLVMVRGADREVRVLSAVCRHRAMVVASGHGRARSLVCPYHSWTYALDGRLLGAPEMSRTPGFDPAACRLPRVRSEVWEGFVFVNFDGEAAPLGPSLAGLGELCRPYDLAGLRTVRRLPFDMECGWNWKLMCENFMEAYHHIGTHRTSLEPHMPARLSVGLPTAGPFSVVHMHYRKGEEPGDRERWGVSSLPPLPALSETERSRVTLVHVFPTGLITLFPDHVELYRLLPEGPARIGLEKLICVPPAVAARETFEAEMAEMVRGFVAIRDEDVAICRAVQQGLSSRFAEAGWLCHLERPIGQFARWVEARLRDR
jgi:phenylpropionate dioxygenase-like ring-hydroxylating dioxygenase large terminal subunit